MNSAATDDAQPEDFADDKKGQQDRWEQEIEAAEKAREGFKTQGRKVTAVFLDERDTEQQGATHWNLFTGDVVNMQCMLYGNVPRADVSRRFSDQDDDVARVAGEIASRLLEKDLDAPGSADSEAYENAILDWLLPGLGVVRNRYEMEEEEVAAVPAVPAVQDEQTGAVLQPEQPEVPAYTRRKREEAPVDFVHWEDFLWGPSRVWAETPWVAFANDMAKAPYVKRFGEKAWAIAPKVSRKEKEEEKDSDPWARVRVWEIWFREEKRVFWFVKGAREILDVKDDPLQLDGFWPCPKPLFATMSTKKLMPKADYYFAQDLYSEINSVSTRIDVLQRAIKAVGVYDKDSTELSRVLTELCQNEMLPVQNWARFAEKGGLAGAMQFVPIEQFATAMMALRDYRRELLDALFQVTGKSDIMRGQATAAGATATEQRIKARSSSVRVQRRMDEVARFVSQAQAIKLEIIAKHFLPETIVEKANAQFAFNDDQQFVQPAVELLKSGTSCYRVVVRPEAVAQTDFDQLKQDRTEVIGALSQFLTAAAPLAQAIPNSMKHLMRMLQSLVAGLKGGAAMEGILDAAIQDAEKAQAQAEANPQQQPPDPKVQAAQLKMQSDQMKAQADVQKEQMKLQSDLTRLNAETQAHDQQEQSQMRWNVEEAAKKQLISNALKPKEVPKPGGFP